MTDFSRARAHMIDSQLKTGGVTNKRILAQMAALPRETFVPPARQATAYIDAVQWLGKAGTGRFIAPPAVFAKLLQLADITTDDRVLDIGAATGYSTAIIAGLAGSVVGFEPDADLAETARANLAALGLAQTSIVTQLPREPFDVVFVEGALESVPPAYLAALKDGGRLIALVWSGGVSVAKIFIKSEQNVAARSEFNATLPPLLAPRAVQDFVF